MTGRWKSGALWVAGGLASAWAARATWATPLAPEAVEPPPPIPRGVTAEEREALADQTAFLQFVLDTERELVRRPITTEEVEESASDNPLMPGAGGVTTSCDPEAVARTDWIYCPETGVVRGATPQEP